MYVHLISDCYKPYETMSVKSSATRHVPKTEYETDSDGSDQEKKLGRGQRERKASQRLKDSHETDFWEAVETCNHCIGETQNNLTTETPNEMKSKLTSRLRGVVENLTRAFDTFRRSTQETINKDIGQAYDRCHEDARKLLHRLEPKPEVLNDGSRHSASTTSSKRVLLAAKAASLQAELEAKELEVRKKAELAELEERERVRQAAVQAEIEQKREELEKQKLLTELRKTEVEMEVLREESIEGSMLNEDHFSTHSRLHRSNILIPSPQPNLAELGEITSSFRTALNLSRLPAPEPTIFKGDPLTYPSWKAAFTSLIDSRNVSASEKLSYLSRYLSGEAKEAVEGMFYFDTSASYEAARKILDERFGNPFLVAEGFRAKLDGWPRIQSGDAKGLRRLSDFLRQCLLAMAHVPTLTILNDCRENRKILSKLPDWIVKRWSRIVTEHTSTGSYPQFESFVSFITKEAEIACNPITTFKEARTTGPAQPPSKVRITPTARALAVESSPTTQPKDLSCTYCKRVNHSIGDCLAFQEVSPSDRRDFLMKFGVCFGCLTAGHKSKECRNKAICAKCNRRLPTCLCGDYEAL